MRNEAVAKVLTTEFAEERMRAQRGINILKKNEKLCELLVSITLCSLWCRQFCKK